MVDRVTINGGTIVLYKVGTGAGAGAVLNEVETIGDIAQSRPEVNATPLSSKEIRYIAGLKDGQSLEIVMFHLGDDASQTAIKAAYDNGSSVEITVQPDPDESDTQVRFTLSLTGHTYRMGSGGDPRRRAVSGRISGPVIEEANART
ncbi:hypothetical protein E4V01_24040 [Methylorubrum sp. Q1]|uniref:hypothetical protein n=1 Tax=Methylorubrum sp. Q1 TaxID=2562453 RepID=UPI001076AC14|nr:hypothetical protein [Methylorubrum sp. Q1]TFZ54986.1 hypothetical protein E4V01_24040 [Methylorubrum sp. Q1]